MSAMKGKSRIVHEVLNDAVAADRGFSRHTVTTVDSKDIPPEVRARSPYTWRELSSGMQHTLDELAALTDNGLVPESLAHVADALDTALCDMMYQLHCYLGEDDASASKERTL